MRPRPSRVEVWTPRLPFVSLGLVLFAALIAWAHDWNPFRYAGWAATGANLSLLGWVPFPILVLALACLVSHAVRTRGLPFALTWILLTAVIGAFLTSLMRIKLPGHRLVWGIRAVNWFAKEQWDAQLAAEVGLGAVVGPETLYLGALFAKWLVERSRFKGRVLPFVIASSLLAVAIAAPLATMPSIAVGIAAMLFSLAYRLVSLRKSNEWLKLGELTLCVPVVCYLTIAVLLWIDVLSHH